jgi:undecaprenyl diphosphate synthase
MEIPTHIAIIMDGNGRWAKKRFLSRAAGHRAGANVLKKLALEADKMGLKHLTVYAFSTENWKRPAHEIDDLMALLREYLREYISDADKNRLKLTVIGDKSRLAYDLQSTIAQLEEKTKGKDGLNVVIALNYGGRDEIIRAVRRAIKSSAPDLTEDDFAALLDTAGIPDPELIIRTSGEQRISNFLLWQSAYAEYFFTDKLWPDFTIDDFEKAIAEYRRRERRFGV